MTPSQSTHNRYLLSFYAIHRDSWMVDTFTVLPLALSYAQERRERADRYSHVTVRDLLTGIELTPTGDTIGIHTSALANTGVPAAGEESQTPLSPRPAAELPSVREEIAIHTRALPRLKPAQAA